MYLLELALFWRYTAFSDCLGWFEPVLSCFGVLFERGGEGLTVRRESFHEVSESVIRFRCYVRRERGEFQSY